MEDEQKDISVAYNLSLLQIQQVFYLLQRADSYFLKCKYEHMLHSLKAVKLAVIQSLTQDERDILEEVEKKASDIFWATRIIKIPKSECWRLGLTIEPFGKNDYEIALKESKQILAKLKTNSYQIATKYKETLMDMLEKHGYLIKKMEDYKQMF